MVGRQSVFKGAFGWDDWVWWVAIGSVALLILLLLVCCCVCMQRAKRKGHEEALASVQTRQRLTQERSHAEQQQQQLQQQRCQQAQQTRDVTFANQNGATNGSHPAYNFSKQVPAAPLPNRKKTLGPQVAANGYHLHTHQFAKPYPNQKEGQATGQTPGHVPIPRKWYNVDHAQGHANVPSTFGYDAHTSSPYPKNVRFNEPYPIGGGTTEVPFIPVKSPSGSKSLKTNRKNGARLPNQAAFNRDSEKQIPAPVVVPTYTRASPSPSKVQASAGLESGTSGGTLQSRIDALRSADTSDMVHSRISVGPTDLPYASAKPGGALGTFAMPGTILSAQESYASGLAGRSGLSAGNNLSLYSSGLSNSLFSSPSSSLHSGRSYETLDPEACESTKPTTLGDTLTHGSSRSIGSDYSYGQFEDTGSFGPDGHARPNNSNGYSSTSNRPARGDNVSFSSHDSVEF